MMKIMVSLFTSMVVLALAAGTGIPQEQKDQSNGIPEKYEHVKNKLWDNPQAIAAGEKIYREKCSFCHGESGDGKGPIAAGLPIKPTDFTDKDMVSTMGDGYWFWRVMKGGAFPPFNSIMPAFENQLTEEQIWQVISYEHTFSHKGPHEHEGVEDDKPHMHDGEKGHESDDHLEKSEKKHSR